MSPFARLASEVRTPRGATEEAALAAQAREPVDRMARGRAGEQAAAVFLLARGYRVIARNQRTPLGELDLICRDGSDIVIVEVKARCHNRYGEALEAIGPRKAGRMKAAAGWWLAERAMSSCGVRFDAVAVVLDGQGAPQSLRHHRDVLGS